MAEPFSFTKGTKTLKIPGRVWPGMHSLETYLWDLQSDPEQNHPSHDQDAEEQMIRLMVQLMKENDAPPEQYARLGVEAYL